MTDKQTTRDKVEAGLAARHMKERVFKLTGSM